MDNKQVLWIAGGVVAFVLVYILAKKRKEQQALFSPGAGSDQTGSSIDENRILGIGTKGPEVRVLQQLLNRDGANPPLVIDGDFGPKTEGALFLKMGQKETTLQQYKRFEVTSSIRPFPITSGGSMPFDQSAAFPTE